MRLRRRKTLGPRLYQGPDRHTRQMFKKHGQALGDALASRTARMALNSGRPWKYAHDRDFHTGLKRLLLRIIAAMRRIAA